MSAYLNRFIGIGRLTKDPELRTLPSGRNYCTMRMALNRCMTDREGEKKTYTCFLNLKAWGRLAEICSENLTKGRLVMAEGELATYALDRPGADPIRGFEVVAREISFLDKPVREQLAA
ncbi:MAG: single-stranded DNA-binding protein [Candidatus Wallbacteria bacterium HGW-Wallbacteria-1]|jgi:single-strand DNA-binding protein|uniref:Single-stranded DNA-binding protein n=1 Tax=Candidatus Wallbacteria bacterium HGW-Wallbacteria-1 TaxID=2013854 RepID=A0A2N1PUT0_9BACT|nr:MAG: single-stranded DNA-binding protein [Candidatus Wallbacteria bacterium HGW-Wallbacteria-1]